MWILSFNFHFLIFSIIQREWVAFSQIFQEHRKQNWSANCQRCVFPFVMAVRITMFNEMHGLYGQKTWFQA